MFYCASVSSRHDPVCQHGQDDNGREEVEDQQQDLEYKQGEASASAASSRS